MSIWWFNLLVTVVQTGCALYLVLMLRNVKMPEEEEKREEMEIKQT